MPRKDGTGPEGKGKGTGRGLGLCNGEKSVSSSESTPKCHRGMGKKQGRRCCESPGQGRGQEQGQGQCKGKVEEK